MLFMGGALLYLAAVLPFLIYHGGIFFYYGDYNVQQVPFYILAHRAVRNGYFFWNPYIDLGSSMGGSLSFYLWGSPFFWLTIPFPERTVPYILPFVMSLRYGTAVVTSYAWIRRQVKSDFWAVTGSFLYAFSGFQACNIVFQHFHDATAFFPLYLLTFDEIVQKRKNIGFILMTALMSIINYYFFFGQVVFLVLYYFVRYYRKGDMPGRLREMLYIVLNGSAGLLIAAFFLVQSITGVSGNSRLDNYINGYGQHRKTHALFRRTGQERITGRVSSVFFHVRGHCLFRHFQKELEEEDMHSVRGDSAGAGAQFRFQRFQRQLLRQMVLYADPDHVFHDGSRTGNREKAGTGPRRFRNSRDHGRDHALCSDPHAGKGKDQVVFDL